MTQYILPIFLFLAGLGVSAIGLILFARTRAFLRRSKTAQGCYIDVSTDEPTSILPRAAADPIVEFQTADEHTVRFVTGSQDLSAKRKISQTVTVRYDPDHPRIAVVDTFAENWLPALTFLLLGLGLACSALIAGIVLFFNPY